jgi:hypothetical protein
MTHNLHIAHKETSARDNLRAAIEALETAELAHAKAIEAEARASNMMSAAEVEVYSFHSLDADVTHHHAGKLRLAIVTGGATPDVGALPAHLQEAKAKRSAAIDKLAAIGAVHAELSADLGTSAMAVERKRYELDLAVEAVVVDDAEALAVQWLADLDDLRRRFWTFEAVAGRKVRLDPDEPLQHFSTGYRPLALGQMVAQITHRSRGVIGGDDAIAEQQGKAVLVGEFVQALHKDPDAKL